MQDDSFSWPFVHRGFAVVFPLALVAGLTGCGSDSKLGSVDGVVRLDGKPLPTGTVRFLPSAGRAAAGEIQSDGTFTLGTFAKKDGALIGMHRVTIVAIQSDPNAPKNTGLVITPNPNIKPLVPKRYMAPGTSKLTFEVKAGDNHAEFNLTSR